MINSDPGSVWNFVLKIRQSLSMIDNYDMLLRSVTQLAGELLGSDVVILYEFDEQTKDVVVPPTIWGRLRYPEEILEKGPEHNESIVVRLISRRRKKNEFFLSNSQKGWERVVGNASRWNREESFPYREGIESTVALRLMAEDERLGLLFLNFRSARSFSSFDRNVVRVFALQAAAAIQYARLSAALEHQIERLHVLSRVGRDLHNQIEERSLFNEIVRLALATLDCSRCTYFALTGNLLEPMASASIDQEALITHTFKLGEGLAGWVAETGKSVLAREAQKWKRFVPAHQHHGLERSMIVAPVIVNEKVVGVISVDQYQPHAFNEKDLQMVEALTLQVEGVLQERQLTQIANLLHEVAHDMSRDLGSADNTLRTIVKGALDLMQMTAGVVHLIDNERHICTQSVQVPDDFGFPTPRFQYGRGMTYETVTQRRIIVAPDISKDDLIHPDVQAKEVQSSVSIPLKDRENVIGTIYLVSKKPRDFSDNEKRVLTTFASHATIAIQNAHRYEKERKRAESINLLQEISAGINAELDDKKTLVAFLEGAMRLTSADSGVIHLLDSVKGCLIASYERPDGFGNPTPRLRDKEGLTWHIIQNPRPEPVIISDVMADPIVHPKTKENGVMSLVGVPLVIEGEVIGVMYLNSNKPWFSDETHLLNSLAYHAALGFRKSKLLHEQCALQNQMAQLSYDALRLTGCPAHGDLYDRVKQMIAKEFKADVVLYLRSPDNPDRFILKYCNDNKFKAQLIPEVSIDEDFSAILNGGNDAEYQITRVSSHRTEGLMILRRMPSPENQDVNAFSQSEKTLLLLVATAIGYTLQKFRDQSLR